jgi:outer membrane protein insertion porin family
MKTDTIYTGVRGADRRGGIARHARRLALAALLLLASGLHAQAPAPSSAPASAPKAAPAPEPGKATPEAAEPVRHIAKINIRGAQRLGKDLLAGLLPFKEGDVYVEQKVKDNFQDLLKKDLFEDLKIEADDAPDGGVILTYSVRELPIVHDVFIENIKAVTQSAALDKLKENRLELATGVTVDYERVKRAEEALRQILAAAGLPDATVVSKLDPLSSGEVNIIFTVAEGPQTRLRKINIVGNHYYSKRRLRGALAKLKRKWLFSFITGHNKFSQGKLDQATEAWREMYESNGFIDYELGEPQIEFVKMTYKTKKGVKVPRHKFVDLTLTIKEGPRYKLKQILFTGNTLFTEPELRKSLPGERPGRFAETPVLKYLEKPVLGFQRLLGRRKKLEGRFVNKPLMKAIGKGIEGRYGSKGYIYANANVLIKRHDDLTADVDYQIGEDHAYYLQRLEFEGNTRTYDKTLRREFEVREQELFRNDLYQTGLYKIQQLSLFELTDNPKIEKVPGETDQVSVKVTGKEAKHDELQVGGGYSGVSGGFFNFSFATRNFLGRGWTLNASASIGSRQTYYSLNLYEPWFLGHHVGASFNLQHTTQTLAAFDRTSKGGGAALTFPTSPFAYWRVGYDFQKVSAGGFVQLQSAPLINGNNPLLTTQTTLSTLSGSWNYDTRNDLYRTSRGGSMTLTAAYTGGVLGGQTNLIRPSLEATYFNSPWRKQTFAFHVNANYISAFGKQEIPNFERFFTGGEFSLRAFPNNGVAPQTSPGFYRVSDINAPVFDFQTNTNVPVCTNGNGTTIDCRFGSTVAGAPPAFVKCQQSGNTANCPDTGGRYFIDPVTKVIQGGNRSYVFNAEYIFHVAAPVDVVLFYDQGQVWHELQTTDLARSLRDVGVEFRFHIPAIQAPLRMFWAKNLTPRVCYPPQPCDRGVTFQFTIGQTF